MVGNPRANPRDVDPPKEDSPSNGVSFGWLGNFLAAVVGALVKSLICSGMDAPGDVDGNLTGS